MDELHSHRSFSNAGGYSFDRTMTYVAHREDSRDIGLEKKWVPIN
jgi:hypothetical protein